MTKTTTIILLVLVLCMGIVYAQNNGNGNSDSNSNVPIYTHNMIGLHSVGLVTENQVQQQAIEEVVNRLQNQYRERLQELHRARIYQNDNNEIIAEGQVPARFMGVFTFMKTNRYVIQQDGTMLYRARWYDFVWSEFEV